MADKETTELVLHGTWSAFEDRGDWRQFEIKVEGKQYPYKLSTKKPEVIEAMMAARDQEATFYGAEQESDKINEHTGKNVHEPVPERRQAGDRGTGSAAREPRVAEVAGAEVLPPAGVGRAMTG